MVRVNAEQPGSEGRNDLRHHRSGPRSRLMRRPAFASPSEGKPSCTTTNSETEAAQRPTPAIRSWKTWDRAKSSPRPSTFSRKSTASPRTPPSTCSSDCRATRMRRAQDRRAHLLPHTSDRRTPLDADAYPPPDDPPFQPSPQRSCSADPVATGVNVPPKTGRLFLVPVRSSRRAANAWSAVARQRPPGRNSGLPRVSTAAPGCRCPSAAPGACAGGRRLASRRPGSSGSRSVRRG